MKEMEQISIMKISSLAKYAVGVTLAAAMLAACSSGGSSYGPSGVAPSGHQTGLTQLSKMQNAALTMPHFKAGPVHTDHGKSWMLQSASKKSALLYVGDWATNDVYVYDYPSGAAVGTLTGFDAPYGQCVDKKGDVFIGNFYAGTTVEYAHGGTSVKNTFNGVGEPIGCSVSAKGDLAVTSFSSGGVTVFAGSDPSKGKSYSDPCSYQWALGYDKAGDLLGVGESNSIEVCALMSGASSMSTLSMSGITIDFPGGTTWDGKYIALGDQEATGTFLTGVWPSTLSGTTVTAVGSEISFSDTCYSNYVDDVNPFFTNGKGKNITPKSKKQAKSMVGPNLWCFDAGAGKVDYWAYPAGGGTSGSLSPSPNEPYGASVSIGK
jgi:hypothetical protein